jgi:hypothetical protein
MSIESGMDKLPSWDHHIGGVLESLGIGLDIILVLIIALCIYALLKWHKQPMYKGLLAAFLLMP